jgi:TRAP-type transport system small permease protein
VYFTLCKRLAQVALAVSVAAMIVVVVVVGWQVFGRYVLNDTPVWAERASLILMLYLCLLGAAVAVRDNTHLGMQWWINKWSARAQHRWSYGLHVLSLLFGAAMLINGFELTHTVWTHSIPTLGISEGLTYLPLVLSGALMVLFAIEHLAAQWLGREVSPTFNAPETVSE